MTTKGTPDDDTLYGTSEDDLIYGLGGDDVINLHHDEDLGAEIADTVHAGAGDDVIKGITIDVADIDDMARAAAAAAGPVIDGGAGNDTVRIKLVNSSEKMPNFVNFLQNAPFKGIENTVLSLAWTQVGQNVTGGLGSEYYDYTTRTSSNLLSAGTGNDVIRTGLSTGIFEGNMGRDTLVTGFNAGNRLIGGSGGDTFAFTLEKSTGAREEAAAPASYADFQPGRDRIVISAEITDAATKVNTKNLEDVPGHIGVNAHYDSKLFNLIDYNSGTGDLTYRGQYVTTLDTGLALDHKDFLFI
jgi:Ca2+-binding RTX toxin-like protein